MDESWSALRQQADLRMGSVGLPESAQERELEARWHELELQREALVGTIAELGRSRDAYKTLFQHCPVAYLCLDEHGRIVEANVAAVELLGRGSQSLVGQHLSSALRSEDATAFELHRRAVFGGARAATCTVSIDRAGGPVPVRLDSAPTVVEDWGQSSLTALIDLAAETAQADAERERTTALEAQVAERSTELQSTVADLEASRAAAAEMEHQLALAERLADLGALAASVAHEMNNPLAYVVLSAEELRRRNAAAGRTEDVGLIDAIIGGATRASDVVSQLRLFARSDSDPVQAVDLPAVIRSALHFTRHDLGFRCRIVRDLKRVPSVLGRPSRLGQVFVALITNAIQAMDEGEDRDHMLTIRTRAEGNEVVVEVTDSGPGISAEALPQIFEPFFTTRGSRGGTGLGLSVVRTLVEQAGGHIEARSSTEGACFLLRFPAQRAALHLVPKPRSEESPSATRARLLIVDDELPLLTALGRALGREFNPTLASSGAEALQLIEEGFEPDLILLDLMMDGMRGDELHAILQESRPALAERVLFLTGGATTAAARRFLEAHKGRVLAKPIDLRQLVAAIRSALK